jgi:hypothetical protein
MADLATQLQTLGAVDPSMVDFVNALATLQAASAPHIVAPAHVPGALAPLPIVCQDHIGHPVVLSGEDVDWLEYKLNILTRAQTRGFGDLMRTSTSQPLIVPPDTDPDVQAFFAKSLALRAELVHGCKGRAKSTIMHSGARNSGVGCWDALLEAYEPNTKTHVSKPVIDICNIRMRDNESIDAFLSRFELLTHTLDRMGHPVPDAFKRALMIHALPVEFGDLIPMLRISKANADIRTIKSDLQHDGRLVKRKSAQPLLSILTVVPDSSATALYARPPLRKTSTTFPMTHGVTHHVTSQHPIGDLRTSAVIMRTADGNIMPQHGIIDVYVSIEDSDGYQRDVSISNVLFCPSADHNLLSVAAAQEQSGAQFHFTSNGGYKELPSGLRVPLERRGPTHLDIGICRRLSLHLARSHGPPRFSTGPAL